MNKILITIAFFITSNCSNAQIAFWNSKYAFLGQTPPADTPKIFAHSLLVPNSGIVLGRVAFSNNGKEFYYTFARHWFDDKGSGVKRLVFDGRQWKKPEVICESLSNPTFSIDGTSLYFGGTESTVWKARRIGNKWSRPLLFLSKPYGLYNFMPAKSGNFYVGSNGDRKNKNDYSAYDFSILKMSAKDTVLKSLGEGINTQGFDGDFYIAPDESYIIVSANETPTFESELHISFRKKDNSWTKPVSLGPIINTGLAHRFGQYVSPDGKYLFYTKGTNEQDCHIYWIRFDTLLKKLKPKKID